MSDEPAVVSNATERSRIRTHAERSVPNEAAAILAKGTVAHAGFTQDAQPYVIPFSYHYDPANPAKLYLHGSPKSRALLHLASGAQVCITVTQLDGLVYSRSALYHSVNYRSVVCFGQSRSVDSIERKQEILEAMIARYFSGRSSTRDYEPASREQLENTMMVEVTIEEMSAKARTGGPKGPRDQDPTAAGSAGILELGNDDCPFKGW